MQARVFAGKHVLSYYRLSVGPQQLQAVLTELRALHEKNATTETGGSLKMVPKVCLPLPFILSSQALFRLF